MVSSLPQKGTNPQWPNNVFLVGIMGPIFQCRMDAAAVDAPVAQHAQHVKIKSRDFLRWP